MVTPSLYLDVLKIKQGEEIDISPISLDVLKIK